MKPLINVRSAAIVLREDNIDTDQIIPARFLTTTTSAGLGVHAFEDWRRDASGRPRVDCPLNDPRAAGAQILIAGDNFGCGSSREHAAWALADMGVRVVISSGIADIFRANAARNGILPVVAPHEHHAELLERPFQIVEVDLDARTVTPDGSAAFPFEIDPFARRCLMEGVDHLGYLLRHMDEIRAFDSERRSEPCAQ